MARNYHLRCWTIFQATPEQVWAQKTDPAALLDEMGDWLSLDADQLAAIARLLRGEGVPGTVQAQATILGLLRGATWPLRVEQVEHERFFVDTSTNALYASWHHLHRLEPGKDAVRYLDAVTFTPQGGLPDHWVAEFTRRLFVRRHRRAARHLPTKKRSTAVAMLREQL